MHRDIVFLRLATEAEKERRSWQPRAKPVAAMPTVLRAQSYDGNDGSVESQNEERKSHCTVESQDT